MTQTNAINNLDQKWVIYPQLKRFQIENIWQRENIPCKIRNDENIQMNLMGIERAH